MRKIAKLEIKNNHIVKGIQLEGVRKIATVESAVKKVEEADAEEIFLVDNTKSLFGLEPNFEMLEKCAELTSLPITFGGGVRTIDHAIKAFSIGASRIYVNTALALDHSLAIKISNICGAQALSGGIEYRLNKNGTECFTHSGRETTGMNVEERILREHQFVSEFIITCIDTDGTGNKPELEQFLGFESIVTPFVFCGGFRHDSTSIFPFKHPFYYSGVACSSSYLLS